VSKQKKLLEKLKSNPKDFTFEEMQSLLESLGYELFNKGKTSGSRIKFCKGRSIIIMHKPHPRKELLRYQVDQIREELEKEGLL